jgi:glycosyltransferase involved in cell wall biosynthesis
MNVAVLNTQIPFVRGGAEVLADDLVAALQRRGHNATLVTLPFKWYPQRSLIDSILACKLLDVTEFNGVPIDRVIALKFPMWLIDHHDKSLWMLHQHRAAYDLWDTQYNDLASMEDGERVRDMIVRQDNATIPECRGIFTISRTVSDRLRRFNGIDSEALYPPPSAMERFHCSDYARYFFCPGRITPLKRQSLIIEALAHASSDIAVVFAGQPDNAEYLDSLRERAQALGVASQLTWLGHVSDEEKIARYANCYMVLFPTYDEDYGYIAPEAMLSSKGVLTLADSGGPLEFVEHGHTGSVVEPDPAAMGAELDRLWHDEGAVRALGESARAHITAMGIGWDRVVDKLLPA